MTEPRSPVPPFLYLFCRVFEAPEYKEDRCLEGATIFEGEKEREQKEKGKGRKMDTRRGEGEKSLDGWNDEARRGRRWEREREREESAVEMKNSPEPKVTTGSYLQIRENNEADSRVEGN